MDRLSRARRSSLPLLATAVVALMVVVLGAGVAVSLRAAGTLESLRVLAIEADQVTSLGEELLIGLLDAESNARAYLLTRRPVFLVPYTTARVSITASMLQLEDAGRRLPNLATELTAIRDQADSRLSVLGDAIQAVDAGSDAAVQAMIASDSGVVIMRRTRMLIERLVQHAAEERDRRSAEERTRVQTISVAVLMGGVSAVLLLGTASLALLAGRERLVRAQRATAGQAALWQATVENMQTGVAVFDSAGGLVQWNLNLGALAGFAPELLRPGVQFERFAHAASLWQPPVLADPTAIEQPAATEVRAGSRVLEVWRNTMPGGGQMVTIGDISRRVDAEAIARQAQKMDVLGQLTGGVAHDFNNLLQVVSANLDLIVGRLDPDHPPPAEWLRSRLTAAMEGVSRGARLTRHLLAFARRQPLAPEAVDADRLLAGLEDMLRRTLGPAVAVELVKPSGLWALRADAQQLENAILNLAINGRDAMASTPPDQARLVIEARNAALDEEYCATNPDASPGQYVMIAVSDGGCGMTAEQVARAIEPFYTTKPAGQGTGLGLSMVYGFAKQSGGHLKLQSAPGRGTTARLYIPRTMALPVRQDATPYRPQTGQGELVLLVEDDPAVRASGVLALRGLGYRVEEAHQADAAMAMLDEGLRPDVLFTDVMMPGTLTSRALAARALTLLPDLAVVFTSGYTEQSVLADGRLQSNVHLLSKPWRIEDLASRLRLALDQGRATPPPRLRILLVEDDVLVRMITADMLADLGHEVVEAGDSDGALRQLGGVGLLITDIGLGQTDGLTLAASARQRVPGLPVIVASGQSRPTEGAADLVWLTKPYDNAALQRALEAVGAA